MLGDGLRAKEREQERLRREEEKKLAGQKPGLEPKPCPGCPELKKKPRTRKTRRKRSKK